MSHEQLRAKVLNALAETPCSEAGRHADAVMAVIEPVLFRLSNVTSGGGCRWCGTRMIGVDKPKHAMNCQLYVGPLEHRWRKAHPSFTFGGLDYRCMCGGWFRQGGLAGHGDGSEEAEPVCPNADQDWRGPRENNDPRLTRRKR